jgi:hypothetical protein
MFNRWAKKKDMHVDYYGCGYGLFDFIFCPYNQKKKDAMH